jgi:transposase
MLDQLDRELDPIDHALADYARRQPACQALIANLYGVGAVTATAILAELGDARRFASSDDAVRHSGLDITVWQSDQKRAAGRLSHQGPSLLRWALFEAAQCAARRSSPDHSYYLQVKARLDHNRACLSVARKLCRRAHHILRQVGDNALTPINAAAGTDLTAAVA